MNQYFVLLKAKSGGYNLHNGTLKKVPGTEPGYETYRQARRAANNVGGKVVKHYTEDDFNRDYQHGDE